MKGLNSIMLIGHAYNIKTMESKNGKPMTFFTLTTYKQMGEGKEDKVQFHNCVSYSKLAEFLGSNLKDKTYVYVSGSVDYYEKDGVTKTQIIVSETQFLSAKVA